MTHKPLWPGFSDSDLFGDKDEGFLDQSTLFEPTILVIVTKTVYCPECGQAMWKEIYAIKIPPILLAFF